MPLGVTKASLPGWAQDFPIFEIEAAANNYRLDPMLVIALVAQESGGVPWRNRVEPTWPNSFLIQPDDFASNLGISSATERMNQSMSWGLMQIMGSVARERGFKSHLTMLTRPTAGLEYGCKQLKFIENQWPNETDMISAYNEGSPKKTPGGMYLNQKTYVDPVCKLLRQLRAVK